MKDKVYLFAIKDLVKLQLNPGLHSLILGERICYFRDDCLEFSQYNCYLNPAAVYLGSYVFFLTFKNNYKSLNLTLMWSNLYRFRSPLKSHPLWITIYKSEEDRILEIPVFIIQEYVIIVFSTKN